MQTHATEQSHGSLRREINPIYGDFIGFSIILLIGVFVFFFRLHLPTLRMWDESRLANNAIEMAQNGNFLVTYFDGKPDHWNLKPPLMIWFMMLGLKLGGYNEFFLRLPSALSGLSTTLILFAFGRFYLQDLRIGFVSALILVTSAGFIGEHVAATADYDAMLVLWMTIYALAFYVYLESQKHQYLLITTGALILAVMTKGIAGILLVPGLTLYALQQKKLFKLLVKPNVYLALATILFTVLGYYFLRERFDPGYVKAVLDNEILRASNSLETHQGEWWFYLNEIKNKFVPWIYLSPIAVIGLWSQYRWIRQFHLFGFFYIIGYLFIISIAQTKLPWYDAPIYPMASLLVGIGLVQAINAFSEERLFSPRNRIALTGLLLAALFIFPVVHTTYTKVYKRQRILYEWSSLSTPELKYGDYLQTLFEERPELTQLSVLQQTEYNAHLSFYAKVAALRNRSINPVMPGETFTAGDAVATCEAGAEQELMTSYTLKELHTHNSCSTFVIR